MSYVEDVAGSGAASWADSFSSLTNINFGSKSFNFGSGSQTVKATADQKQDATTSTEARAVASTAKAGDGGVAESSASLSEVAAANGIDLKTALIALLCTLAAGLGAFALFKRKPGKTRRK